MTRTSPSNRIPIRRWRRINAGRVLVGCPSCHTEAVLQHTIDDKGNLHPSLICPCCDFHYFARLEGYGPDVSTGPDISEADKAADGQ